MKAFEKQLQAIGDKSALHEWIDSLPDDPDEIKVLILAQHADGSHYNTYGQPSLERLLWMVKTFENHLLANDD